MLYLLFGFVMHLAWSTVVLYVCVGEVEEPDHVSKVELVVGSFPSYLEEQAQGDYFY